MALEIRPGHDIYPPLSTTRPEKERCLFLDAIGRPDLHSVLTASNPWVIPTPEIFKESRGLPGSGGLGILISDQILQARKLGLPLVAVSNLYPKRLKQVIGNGFYQQEESIYKSPEEMGYSRINSVQIKANEHTIDVGVYKAQDLPFYGLYEPGLAEVYACESDSDHRHYQQSVLGFGGLQALEKEGISPSKIQLSESSSHAVALAVMDRYCQDGLDIHEALRLTRADVFLTNHTLVPAAIASISRAQIENYLLSNLKNENLKKWLLELTECQGNLCNLSKISTTLSGKANGVSMLHAEIATGQFTDADGREIKFSPITNGIFLDRWVEPELMRLYRRVGALDKFDLPANNLASVIGSLSSERIKEIKEGMRDRLKVYLRARKDQYGQAINIPENAKIACWTKRLADYKRPGMFLADKERLKEILKDEDIHIILSGRVHPEDKPMKEELQKNLYIIDGDEELKKRVHFVQNYDEDLAKFLVAGVDIWFNTPELGNEACGTSWMKALGNLAVLISTEDGGVADVKPAKYLKIKGRDYKEEVDSLYRQFKRAGEMVNGKNSAWGEFVKGQLTAYLSILSASRMIRDYLNFAYLKAGN